MGKNTVVSDEEILGFLREGWRIRRKKVGEKYEYIIRRRGLTERSMGPFNEGLWNRILALEYRFHSEEGDRASPRASLTRRDYVRIARSRDRLSRSLRAARGIKMAERCAHAVEGFCGFWVWEREELFFSYFEDVLLPGTEYRRRIVSDEGVDAWIIRADYDYCVGCPAFTPISSIPVDEK